MSDLFLVNGRFYTQDSKTPNATAVAIRGNRFWAVGDDAEIRALAFRQLPLASAASLAGVCA